MRCLYVKSGTLLAATFRAIRDWVHRHRTSLIKPGRNAVLPAGVEKRRRQRIVHLQQVRVGLTQISLAGALFKYARNQPTESMKRQSDGNSLIYWIP